jgi:hypothetical protein
VKSKLKQIPEIQEEKSPAASKKQRKRVGEINEFLKLISQEAREEFFGENNNESNCQILNSSPEERAGFIEWLDGKITEAIADETKGTAERYKRWKVQDTYRTSKSAAMKKYVNKKK